MTDIAHENIVYHAAKAFGPEIVKNIPVAHRGHGIVSCLADLHHLQLIQQGVEVWNR